jgi:hypothetical protein
MHEPPAGLNDGDLDADGLHLVAEDLGKAFDGEFRGLIGAEPRRAANASTDGGELDEVARALLAQHRQGGLGGVDNTEQVRLDLRAEVVVRGFLEWARCLRSRRCSRRYRGTQTRQPPSGLPRERLQRPLRQVRLNGYGHCTPAQDRRVSLDGERVATTLSPLLSTALVSSQPKPRELPVMSHTLDILIIFLCSGMFIRKLFPNTVAVLILR